MTDTILDALDPEQLRVATEFDAPLVVLAGAGTGKTRAVTHRIANAVREGRYAPTATLAVTFTTRAAGEMRSRLAGLGVRGAQARTIHAAALRQCQFFWPQAFGFEFPGVAENTFGIVGRAASRVLGSSDTALVRDLDGEISWAKSSNVPVERYPELAAATGRTVSGASPQQVASVMGTYERLKSDTGVVDFADILLCCAALLSEHPPVAEQIRDAYRHFVVDEYQDVSAVQHRLVMLWVDGRQDVCVVGDPNQSIHGFAGARPEFLTRFGADVDGARQIRLTRNYRSSPEVLDVANRILRRHPGPDALRATQPSGPRPTFRQEGSDDDEAAGVAEWLAARHGDGSPWGEMAVLYRINAQSPLLEAALTDRGIPYTVRGSDQFWDRAEVRIAVGALLGAAPEGDVPPEDVLEAALQRGGWSATAPAGMGRQRERWESLTALRGMAVDHLEAHPGATLADLQHWVRDRANLQAAPVADAVTLSTMHAAKGLEWDDVAVVGVREGLVPFSLSTEEPALSEERRLLHVAVTRARRTLRISWASATARGRRSRFLTGIDGSEPSGPAVGKKVARTRHACPVCNRHLATGAERKLGHHAECDAGTDVDLFNALKAWRKDVAAETSVPAFVVFTDATLQAIAGARPATRRELLKIPGVGPTKADRYGEATLAIVAGHPAE